MMQEEVLINLEGFVEKQLPLLKSVEESWQPGDFLPDMASDRWQGEVEALRARAKSIPDDLLVVLVGNTVTEEALPSYQTWLNRPPGLKDETGASVNPWALWTRGWTAEENRHGEVLGRYLYLSGRVDMRSVEVTTQHLIRNGFDLKSGNDAYKAFVYVAFQERATKVSHANVGRLAEGYGDPLLARICSTVAADEARHEEAYKRIFGMILVEDPSNAVLALDEMVSQKVVMPARLMSDGADGDLFEHFALVAQRAKIYTVRDYAAILDHLMHYWNIAGLTGLEPEAARAQERLCGLADHYQKRADRFDEVIARAPKERFRWIFNREI
ncbi:MAG: acyl-ACP desaturase [Candidatus Omnitrophica bacterium]|nr:acyl-ACP desaturase [Candidatus Omnitrophota bacterium]